MVGEVRPRMAQQAMGKSMGNRACDWVRARLPLWVGDEFNEDPTAGSSDDGDLPAMDRREIGRHLEVCASCRQHWTTLDQAFGAIFATASQRPVEPKAPSIWPLVEEQIANREANVAAPRLRSIRRSVDRSVALWSIFDGNGSLRRTWTRDSLRYAFGSRTARNLISIRKPRLLLGFAAEALVVTITVLPILRRQGMDGKRH